MVYSFRCLMPEDHYVEVYGKAVKRTSEPVLESHEKVVYYSQRGERSEVSVEELSEKLQFEYTTRLVFLHERDLRNCIYQCVERTDQCSVWLSSMRKALLEGSTFRDVSLRHIGTVNGVNVGHGVFAEVSMKAGTFIGEYVGLVSTISETITREDHYNFQYPSCDGGLEINGREIGNLTRFINHSSMPNAEFNAISLDDIMHVICVSAPTVLHLCTAFCYRAHVNATGHVQRHDEGRGDYGGLRGGLLDATEVGASTIMM